MTEDDRTAREIALAANRDAIRQQIAPHEKARAKLVAEIQKLEQKLEPIHAEIRRLEAPLRDIGNELAAIARARGARTLHTG